MSIKENADAQKQWSLNQYKKSSRVLALNSAIALHTNNENFDIITKADEIYKWLIDIDELK